MTVLNPQAIPDTPPRRPAGRVTRPRRDVQAAALRAPHRPRAAPAVAVHTGVPAEVLMEARMAVADTTDRSLPTNNRRGRFLKGSPRRLNFQGTPNLRN